MIPLLGVAVSFARSPLPHQPIAWPDAPAVHLTVRFRDEVGARPDNGGLVVRPGLDRVALDGVVSTWGLRFSPLVDVEGAALDALAARAQARTGEPAADLRGLYLVEVPGADRDATLAAARALDRLDAVEYVHLHGSGWAPPEDYSPPTDDYADLQGWLGPDPGIDAAFAAERGFRGARVGLADCEYDWNDEHEDLVDVDLGREEGQGSPSYTETYGFDQHGTAAIGMIVAGDNGYGALGAAPDAIVTTWPEASRTEAERRVTAIANAVAHAAPGDVVMLEMQGVFRPGGDYAPAEVDIEVWEIVRQATDAGVIVVAAAGNGDEDLDDEWYAENWLEWGDSGALIVGAGGADVFHRPLSYTTHGSRVNLQGWGLGVFTTGYGDAYQVGDDVDQAYTYFSGTSSATPMVAAAAVLVQDFVVSNGAPPLDAFEMRDLLVETGIPQGGNVTIGPLPDLAAAFAALDGDDDGHIGTERGGEDCDDGDAAVYPGAPDDDEAPGVDLNCDGETPRCGCSSGPGPVGWAVGALALVFLRRTREVPARAGRATDQSAAISASGDGWSPGASLAKK